MNQSFIFGGNTGLSYDQIQKQRDIANELLRANMSTPQNVGEGLSAIGRALAAKAIDKRTSRADEANRKAYEARRGEVFGMLGGQGGAQPSYSGSAPNMAGPTPITFTPETANPAGLDPSIISAVDRVAPNQPQQMDASAVGTRLLGDLMRDFNLTQDQAAGVVGNLAHETGGFKHMQEIAPVVPGSRGGFGFAQWTGPRRKAFEAWSAENGLDPTSYEANYGFLQHELKNTPEGAVLGPLSQAQTADQAAQVFSNQFLRPGVPAMGSRQQFAQKFADPQVLMALAEVQGDPYASESDKAIASLLMQQTVQAMDPMRQMEMEKARLELDQMRNPQAPSVVTERRALAAEAGLQPGTPEYQAFMANGEMPVAGGKDDPTSVREYQFYAQQAIARGEQPIPYEKFITLEAAAGNPAAGNFTQPVTPGQEQIDKAYAPEYVQWTQGGGADMANQIATVEGIADRLESGKENLTGPGVGSQPDWLGAWTTPNAVSAREDVESVVQRNLRVLLGAQFTQAEGDRLIARAYNPRLPEEENAIRLRRLAKGMRAAADARADQAAYYQKNGTLVGWEGKVWTPSDFENIIDNDTPDVSAEDQEAFKAFAADPSAVAAAQKYGVTLEEMWAIKKGQQ